MHKKYYVESQAICSHYFSRFLSSNDTSYVFALHFSKVNRSLYRDRISLAGKKPHGIRINGPFTITIEIRGSITRQQSAVLK